MPNFNKVILAGHLTRDPELRHLANGTAVAAFGIATNRNWKTESGEEKSEVCFVDVTAFGRQAEVIGQYVKKGHPFLVEGRLKLDQWEDKNTHEKRSKIAIMLESFSFLTSKADGESAAEPRAQAPARTPSAPTPAPASKPAAVSPTNEDSEIPF